MMSFFNKTGNVFKLTLVLLHSIFCILLSFVLTAITFNTASSIFIGRRIWAPVALWALAIKLKIYNRDSIDFGKTYIYAGNHQSYLDIPAIFVAIKSNFYFVAKEELKKVPLLGWYMQMAGMIFVDRQSRDKSFQSIKKAGKLVRKGKSVMTFPEGTRSVNGKIKAFKRGAFHLAVEARVPVIPMAIEGAHDILPPGGSLLNMKRGTIKVIFGSPVSTENLTKKDIKQLTSETQAQIEKMHNEIP